MPDFMRSPRASALLWLAVLQFVMAARLPYSPAVVADQGVIFEAIPLLWRSVMWTVCGVVAFAGAWWRRFQTAGFVAAVLMPVERFFGYVWSWGESINPAPPPGRSDAILDAMMWLVIIFLIINVTKLGRPHRGDAPYAD